MLRFYALLKILASVFNIPLSTGTIKNMVTRFFDRIASTCEKIRQVVAELDLINCDETGCRVDGRTGWIHDASNALYTYLTFSWKRGCIGMDEADVLPNFRGILLKMKKKRDLAVARGKEKLSYYYLHMFDKEYDEILIQANEENPVPEKEPGKRDRVKKTKVQNLIARLEKSKASVCLFTRNFLVPFDNN